MKHPFSIGVLVAIVVCSLAEAAHANVLGPYLFPGLLPISANWLLAIPTTVLVAVLECPFVRRAGVAEAALRHCLWANVVSTAVGFLAMPVAMFMVFSILAPMWLVLAVGGSILIEGVYYQRFARVQAKRLRWAWITAGNVLSSFLLLAMSVIAHYYEGRYRHFAGLVQRHELAILLILSLAIAVVLWKAFVGGLSRRRGKRERELEEAVGDSPKEQHAAAATASCPGEQRSDEQVSSAS